ncbi:hypothetical protein KGD82_13590 [Nocardiopsis eucommiae]|uniref:Uncharacterized protein n=1 Tax=Nocardiopsis eucommiae TaxID=2831970 RepID=A0A975LDB2_9ACTN|nr:hypothetical protein KGD82_13590 [Nocardiopsis eucommiae]
MSDPKPADTIRVQRHGDRLRITVDGVVLPFEVDAGGVQTVIAPGAHPGLMLTIPARRVLVDDCLDEVRSPEKQARIRAKLDSLAPPS